MQSREVPVVPGKLLERFWVNHHAQFAENTFRISRICSFERICQLLAKSEIVENFDGEDVSFPLGWNLHPHPTSEFQGRCEVCIVNTAEIHCLSESFGGEPVPAAGDPIPCLDGIHNDQSLKSLQEIKEVQASCGAFLYDLKVENTAESPAEIANQADSYRIIR
jgi:hypothetical protein